MLGQLTTTNYVCTMAWVNVATECELLLLLLLLPLDVAIDSIPICYAVATDNNQSRLQHFFG
jgi:hypothetical protein